MMHIFRLLEPDVTYKVILEALAERTMQPHLDVRPSWNKCTEGTQGTVEEERPLSDHASTLERSRKAKGLTQGEKVY